MNEPPVCIFSKHLQFLNYTGLARTCKAIGLDGVDLTVRKGGHVLPENVGKDLPKAVEAIRAEGLDVPMITTSLNRGDDPDARPILEAASKLGIPYFRIGGQKYEAVGNPLDQLPKCIEQLRTLSAIAEELHVTAGYHNHSGYNNVGAALWDLERILEAVNSEQLGSNFDVGHAKVEGGYGAWQVNARLLARRVKMLAVKDFVWEKGEPRWVPLGQGHVDLVAFLKIFHEAGLAGPISIHIEYKTPSNDALIEEIRQAAITVRKALKDAGYV